MLCVSACVYNCLCVAVCFCQISALEEEASAMKKQNEALQMKLKASKGEKTGIITLSSGFVFFVHI